MIGPRRVIVAAGDSLSALPQLAGVLPQAVRLLDAAEALVARITVLVDRIEDTNLLALSVAERASATEVVAAAAADKAALTAGRVSDLVDRYEPGLADLSPVVVKAAQQLAEQEAADLVSLVSVLRTLQSVAPDLAELLEVSRTLNEMLGAVPGLSRVKKRIDEDDG